MLRLQKYVLNVCHKPGKEIPVTDTLSHLHLTNTDDTYESFDAQVQTAMANLPIQDTKILELQSKTRDDLALQQLTWIVHAGWQNHLGSVPNKSRRIGTTEMSSE